MSCLEEIVYTQNSQLTKKMANGIVSKTDDR